LGDGRFRLSRLLRGRGGTEWACTGHAVDEMFCLMRPESVRSVLLPSWSIGAVVTARTGDGVSASIGSAAENLRPLSPAQLTAVRESNGDLSIGWIRRSRQGFAWIDGVDAPLGETAELYRVLLSGSSAMLERDAAEPRLTIAAADVATVGSGPASIEVRQIGDLAASRPASIDINL